MENQENQKQQMQWLKLTLPCPMEMVEAVGDLLAARSGSGVEQSPEQEGSCVLAGFFALEEAASAERVVAEIKTALAELFALYDKPLPEIRQQTLADEDWATSWQQYFKPFAVVPGLVIKPSWEAYRPQPGEKVVEMDPGMAFGTGQHASTRGALLLMQRAFRDLPPALANRVLDVGTGTGILAMAAALWGAQAVLALDNDPEAVRVAEENVAHNSLADRIQVSLTPLAEMQGSFGLVTANIVHDVLVALRPDLTRLVASSGFLVLAGVLAGAQENNLIRLYGESGLHLVEARYEDEWVALLLEKNANP